VKALAFLAASAIACAQSAPNFALSTNGRFLAVSKDGGRLAGFELPSGRLLWQRKGASPVSALAASPDGAVFAVAYQSSKPHVELRSASTGEKSVTLEDKAGLSSVSNDSSTAVTFSADGAMLAAALRNGVRVWNVKTGRTLYSIEPPGFETRQGVDIVQDLAFLPGSQEIAGIGTNQPALFIWRLKSGKLERRIFAGKSAGELTDFAINASGSLFAVGTTGPTRVYRRNGALVCIIREPGPIGPVGFDKQAVWILAPKGVERWTCDGLRNTKQIEASPQPADAVFELDDHSFVALNLSKSGKVTLTGTTGRVITTLQLP
jgi:WD40 repeat protein